MFIMHSHGTHIFISVLRCMEVSMTKMLCPMYCWLVSTMPPDSTPCTRAVPLTVAL